MLTNLLKLEAMIEGKAITLLCNNDCPLPHVKEALFQFLKYAGQIEDQIKAQQAQAEEQKAVIPIAPDAIDPPATQLVA